MTNQIKKYIIPIDFTLDSGKVVNKKIVYTSGDINTAVMAFELSNNGEIIDLNEWKVLATIEREDQYTTDSFCTIDDAERGKASLVLTTSMLYVGVNHIEISLTKVGAELEDTREMVSPKITYKVLQSIKNERDSLIPNTNEYPILVQLIKDVENLKETTNTFLQQATENETARQESEEIRISQENERQASMSSMQETFANKIIEVDSAKSTMIQDVTKAKEAMKNEVTISKNDMIQSVNTAKDTMISETTTAKNDMISKVDNKIKEVDSTKNNMVDTVNGKIAELDGKFAELQKQDVVSEIMQARDGEESLSTRLERDLLKGKVVRETKEGKYLSFDATQFSPITDIELQGDTIQKPSDLADIKSTGIDNGDGTWSYEIVSCGENLFNGLCPGNGYSISETDDYYILENYKTSAIINQVKIMDIKFKPNTRYTFTLHCKELSDSSNCRPVIIYTDKTEESICFPTESEQSYTFTSSASKTISHVSFGAGDGVDTNKLYINKKRSKIQEGIVATPYTPYEETRCTIKLPCQLEKWDRLYFDKEENAWCVEKKTIKVKLGKKLPATQSSQNGTTTYYYSIDLGFKTSVREVICNILPYNTSTYAQSEDESICVNGGLDTILVRVKQNKIGDTSRESGQKYFNDSNAYALVSISTPQKITLPQSEQIKLNSFANKTHIYTISGDVDATIKATVSKSVSATVESQREAIKELQDVVEDIATLKESQDLEYVTDSGYKVCKATKNGVVKDLKISGRSLVNLWGNKSSHFSLSGQSTFNEHTQCIELTTTENRFSNAFVKNLNMLKVDTDYTVVVNVFENTLTSDNNIFINNPMGDTQGAFDSIIRIPGGNTGVFVYKIRTRASFSTLTDHEIGLRCYIDALSSVSDKKVKFQIIILEGDHTQNPPSYFEGIASVGNGNEIEVLTNNENYFDFNKFYYKKDSISYEVKGNSIEVTKTNGGTYDYVGFRLKLVPNKKYVVGATLSKSDNCGIGIKDVNGIGLVGDVTINANKREFVTPQDGVVEIRFYPTLGTSGNAIMVANNVFVIGYDNKNNTFVSNKQDKKTILFKDVDENWKPVTELRGIDLNTCDTIEEHSDGKHYLHVRTDKKVLNGDVGENWQTVSGIQNQVNTMAFSLEITEGRATPVGVLNVLNDKFVSVPNNSEAHNDKELLAPINASKMVICIRITKSKLSSQDVEGFKQWLQSNPVTVIYQLAKEKVYEVNIQNLDAYEGDTFVQVTSNIVPPTVSWKITSYINSVIMEQADSIDNLEDLMTEVLLNLNNKKEDIEHNHDDRYYTEAESNEKFVNKIPRRIDGNIDLNTITTPGNYIVASNNVVNSPKNYGRLVVLCWDSSVKWITQVLYSDVHNEVYTRCSTNDTATSWTSWAKMYSTQFKPTWEDITSKPSTFTPSNHDHNSDYYTKNEMDSKLSVMNAEISKIMNEIKVQKNSLGSNINNIREVL